MTLPVNEHYLKMMDDEEFETLHQIVGFEHARRGYLRNCKHEVDERIDAYMNYASKEAKDIKTLSEGATIAPGEILRVGQDFFVNISRTWLDPFKAGPTAFVAGWEKQKGGVA